MLQSKPSVLWPAAFPPLLELGASPAAVSDEYVSMKQPRTKLESSPTVVDGELGHHQRSRVRDAVYPGRGVENLDVLHRSNEAGKYRKHRERHLRSMYPRS